MLTQIDKLLDVDGFEGEVKNFKRVLILIFLCLVMAVGLFTCVDAANAAEPSRALQANYRLAIKEAARINEEEVNPYSYKDEWPELIIQSDEFIADITGCGNRCVENEVALTYYDCANNVIYANESLTKQQAIFSTSLLVYEAAIYLQVRHSPINCHELPRCQRVIFEQKATETQARFLMSRGFRVNPPTVAGYEECESQLYTGIWPIIEGIDAS